MPRERPAALNKELQFKHFERYLSKTQAGGNDLFLPSVTYSTSFVMFRVLITDTTLIPCQTVYSSFTYSQISYRLNQHQQLKSHFNREPKSVVIKAARGLENLPYYSYIPVL